WSIGKKYHVSVDSLRRLNNLTSDIIMPGQKLLIMKEQRS
ncbi:MAG: LysM peptidoglycan-binding domain-containing protein, partial [Lachnospiraceae bacterium]|nr:LysM peptidoglycan-binding domain-containing protein [Lachnospiraceae bacterium]